jgi:hypothetical protein
VRPLGIGLAGDDATLQAALADGPVDFVERALGGAADPDDPFARLAPADAAADEARRAAEWLRGTPTVARVDLAGLDGEGLDRAALSLRANQPILAIADGAAERVGFDRIALPLTPATAALAAARAGALAERVATPVLSTIPDGCAIEGDLHPCDFLAALAGPVCIDLDRLLAHQAARGHAPDQRFEALPLDRVAAIRLGCGAIAHRRGVAWYDDSAPAIAPDALALLARLAPRCPSLAAVILRAAPPPALAPARRLLAGRFGTP